MKWIRENGLRLFAFVMLMGFIGITMLRSYRAEKILNERTPLLNGMKKDLLLLDRKTDRALSALGIDPQSVK